MVDSLFLIFMVTLFVAVVLGFEGAFMWWNARRGPEAQRMARRLMAASAGGHGASKISILKRQAIDDATGLQRMLLLLPRVHTMDRMVEQSGLTMSVGNLIGLMLLCGGIGLFSMVVLGRGWLMGFIVGAILWSLPLLYVRRKRQQRLAKLGEQLPDAIDLMGRALRAGHAFQTALNMVGEEMAEPVGKEFRILFDEINYGITLQDAMMNLLERVPSDDLKYMAVAVLIQRETGGNLAELLDNISSIIRARMKLMGEIRTLSAEGRMSAWILGVLPFAVGLVINLVNPEFLDPLWHDPMGIKMVYAALVMMVLGVLWMRKIIRIRV